MGNHVRNNYIGLRFGSNSDDNRFSENVFARNLHPVETGVAEGSGNQWAMEGVGNYWETGADLDFNQDGVGDLPHRELDLFGILRRDFPAIAFLSASPAVKLLHFANERAADSGLEFNRRSGAVDFAVLETPRATPGAHNPSIFQMIAVHRLTKSYGAKEILRGITFERNRARSRCSSARTAPAKAQR